MELLFVIGGTGLAFAMAIVALVVRARRRHSEDEASTAAKLEAQRQAGAALRRAEEEARVAAEREVQRQAEEARRRVEEAACAEAEREAERQLEEARQRADAEARATAEQELQRQAEEARYRAEEEARTEAERERQRQAEEQHQRAEAEARVAAEKRQSEEAQRRAEEEARAEAERVAQRQAEEKRQPAEEEAPLVGEREAQRYGEAADRGAEEAARLAAEQQSQRQAETARRRPEVDTRRATDVNERRETEEPGSQEAPPPGGESAARRRAPQYRPPSGGSGAQQPADEEDTPAVGGDAEEPTAATTRAVSIELRVLFDRSGCCRVTLLPKRRAGLPEDCAVSTADGGSLDLVALEDEWYQDVAPEDLGTLLRTGTLWTHHPTGQEWVLAGREIFVLAVGTAHRGFVTCPRLTLGREHAVLCMTTRLAAVEDSLQKAGCTKWTVFREEDGTPSGWLLVADTDRTGRPRGLVPNNAVPMEEGSDILNVLRPLPQIEISLEGGVPLGYSSWLAGYPPAIRVLGDVQHVQTVLIDGKDAAIGPDGAFRAPGWDEPGSHQVWCSNVSRGYSLIRLERSWDQWPAYVFPSASGAGERLAICGPLVRPFATGETLGSATNRFEAGGVLQSNPVLLGAIPGQVLVTIARRDLRGALCFARPPFTAVWALPAQPLRCDKMAHRILLVGETGIGMAPDVRATAGAVSRWCRLILDASRKGLAVEPAAARDLWVEYKRVARNLWRKGR